MSLFLFCLKLKSGLFKHTFPTIQKPYLCIYCNSAMAGPSDAMKPERFAGGNFRRWQTRVKFWLMSMELWWVVHPVMSFMVEQTAAFAGDSDKTLGCILSLLSDQLYDLYMDYTNPTELWDALERKFTVSEGGRLLYTCEQFYDFSVDAAKSIVAQAHEMLLLVGEIASLGCPLPDRFVAAGIIAKLPAS